MSRSFFAVLACAALAVTVPLGAAGQTTSANASPRYSSLAFTSGRHGWAAGRNGIEVTNDGGRHWRSQYSGGRIDQLVVVNDRVLFARGAGLVRSLDGGVSWQPIAATPSAVKSIAFATDRIGAGVGADGRLYTTADGGASWKMAALATPVTDACYPDPGHLIAATNGVGNAVGGFSGVSSSLDGGATWVAGTPPPADGAAAVASQILSCTGGVVWDLVDYGDASGGDAYLLARSADGLHGWTPVVTGGRAQPLPHVAAFQHAESQAMSAYSQASATVVGICATCVAGGQWSVGGTRDGGRTWFDNVVPGAKLDTAAAFGTPSRGWIAGRVAVADGALADAILRTDDGGRHWSPVYVSP